MEDKHTTQIIRRTFWSLLPVQAMVVGIPAINGLLDTLISGNLLGQTALAAMGFTGPLNMLLVALSNVIATGSQLICGQRLGKGDREGVLKAFNTALGLCVVLGLAFATLVFLFPGQVAGMLGAEGPIRELTAQYVRGWSVGMAFSVLMSCTLPFAQMDRMGKLSTASVAVMAVVNIGSDLVTVLMFDLGIFGIGLATTIANTAALLVILPYFLKNSKTFSLGAQYVDPGMAVQILYQGLPNAVAPVCLVIRDRVLNQFIFSLGGAAAMSAIAVSNNVKNATGSVVQAGYAGSARLIGSVLVGERDSSSLRDLPRIMERSAGFLYVVAYGIIFVFARPLALLFGAEPESVGVYVLILRLFNLWFLTNIFKEPPLCIYQALGKVKLLVLFTVLANLVFPVTACLLLANLLGLPVVVCTNLISEFLMMGVMAGYFAANAKRLPRDLTELAYIPSNMSAPRENRMKAVIRSVEDCTAAAERATEFCLEKGMSSRNATYCGLCIEEMAVDTIINRFRGEGDTLDLRMIYEDGSMSILLRDDCAHFDPKQWLELCSPEEQERSIGIRMVSKISKEMNYASALGLNVLTIKI